MAIPEKSEFVDVGLNCILCCVYVYGCFLLTVNFVCCPIPVVTLGSLLLFFIIYYFRIPPPPMSIVDEVLGQDPWYVDESNTSGNSSYFMKSCAHRGGGMDSPENSLAAFRRCMAKGCTAVEFDVSLTKDLVPIVFHDPDVNRLCDATGYVKDMTWNELKELDISVKHPLKERYSGETIAHFDDALTLCLELDLRIFLDIKGDDLRILPIILEAYKKHEKLYKRAVVSSFNPILIYMIRRADPQIIGSLAWRPCFFTYMNYTGITGGNKQRYSNTFMHYAAQVCDALHSWTLDHITYYVLGLSAILLIKDEITVNVALRWHKRGVSPIAWSVNLPAEKQYFKNVLKVTYMTDTLDV